MPAPEDETPPAARILAAYARGTTSRPPEAPNPFANRKSRSPPLNLPRAFFKRENACRGTTLVIGPSRIHTSQPAKLRQRTDVAKMPLTGPMVCSFPIILASRVRRLGRDSAAGRGPRKIIADRRLDRRQDA